MPFIITDPCIDTKDTACVDVCPVDCIHPRKDEAEFAAANMLYIHPEECIAVSNDEWESPIDPDSRITKMKDGTTHLAYKAEHAVDLDTRDDRRGGDLFRRSRRPAHAGRHGQHGAAASARIGQRRRGERGRGRQGVSLGRSAGDVRRRDAVSDLHPRTETAGGTKTRLDRQARDAARRGRTRIAVVRAASAADDCSVSAANGWSAASRMSARRAARGGPGCCGIEKVRKRYLIAAVAHNLGRLMRALFGIGTPRGLQAAAGALSAVCHAVPITQLAGWGWTTMGKQFWGIGIHFGLARKTTRWPAPKTATNGKPDKINRLLGLDWIEWITGSTWDPAQPKSRRHQLTRPSSPQRRFRHGGA